MSNLAEMVERISELTESLDREERGNPSNTEGIERIYRMRGKVILRALELGARPAYLSEITGNR